MNEVVLKAVNLHKSYKTFDDLHILKGISLTLKQNESIAIMGSSGAGKTTLLHILGTLESFDSGKINILNSSSKNNEIRNKHIGFIFQAYNLIDDLTLLENVLMP
ncbi:MAG: Lipoprotein-releasing system ATP-binding protein LolD, partial [Candidatus Anoxychlamydiales bacterium]|nr:Lipoprotein-releasing system ATP-binding protein LolD [Candidatus Anoxychlamydiales bacterium]